MVERILEKHSTTALVLCDKQLNVSALRPRPDTPLLSCKIDHYRLLFSNLPDSVDTNSFMKYLQRALPSRDTGPVIDRESTITSVMYGMRRGIAMAVFQQPYGKQIHVVLAKALFNKCIFCIIPLKEIAVYMH